MPFSRGGSRTYTCATSVLSSPFTMTRTTATEPPVPDTTVLRNNLIRCPSGALRVEDGGSGGVPVLFVPSFGEGSDGWALQLAALRRERRAVALDLSDRSSSEETATDTVGTVIAVETFANDIGVVADTLGLQRFVVVGHRLGGAAALKYAGEHPERVAGLVLVGIPGAAATATGASEHSTHQWSAPDKYIS